MGQGRMLDLLLRGRRDRQNMRIARISNSHPARAEARAMPARKAQVIQRRDPRQRRACATVEAILEAAARIIRREGAEAANTNRIAEVAGVSIGSLYGYFRDKSAVLVALARRLMAGDEAAMAAALAHAAPDDRVRALVRTLIARHLHDPAVRRAVMAHHIGLGFGGEHGDVTQAVVARIAARLGTAEAIPPARFFVVTRAVLGACRALTEEASPSQPAAAALEDELVRLVYLSLGEEALRWRA
jgi:AcrR family transcriptional regulator